MPSKPIARWGRRLAVLALAAIVVPITQCSSPSLVGTYLRRSCEAAPAGPAVMPAGATAGPPLTAVVYNVHRGLGRTWWARPEPHELVDNLRRIAVTIADSTPGGPDLVGLNEVDFASRRTQFVDQAQLIARVLQQRTGNAYQVVKGANWTNSKRGGELRYGNALLVRHPLRRTRSCLFDDLDRCGDGDAVGPEPRLPALARGWAWLSAEPRGVTVADLEVDGRPLRVVLTHLDPFTASLREAEAARLLHHLATGATAVVVLGDLNAVPTPLTHERWWFGDDRTHDVITSGRLVDVRIGGRGRADAADWRRFATFPADEPRWPLDAILASPELTATRVQVIDAGTSDHRGIVTELAFWRDADGVEQQRRLGADWRRQRLGTILACAAAQPPAAATAALQQLGVSLADVVAQSAPTVDPE